MALNIGVTICPCAEEQAVIKGNTYRFTVLTEALLRIEYDAEGRFCDLPSQTVVCRAFPQCAFEVRRAGDGVVIETEKLRLTYTGGAFTADSLSVLVKDSPANETSTYHFGDVPKRTRGGTARTLDTVDGACDVGQGLFSFEGWEVLEDSNSLLLTEDGWIQPRRQGTVDLYLFGYNRRYLEGLKAFYRLTGDTPMLPRFALGNWWSRYFTYSDESYMKLMDDFRKERVPFSVAVIDMDWHITEVEPRFGIGWTGFTWNRKLFPDPADFLRRLHARGMHTTLNLHPADGIRAYEDCYPALAADMGVDTAKEEKVAFDVTNRRFLDCYFKDVLHPMEEEGVDFWWVDWQQGTHTSVPGLDPLWMLNHFHFLDSARDGKRPMTFSRYAGPGSHRYPVGFSGDTVVSWASLDFQPYFTANADNIGYGWWSHDIGGHMQGIKDDELYGRWIQFGVFSPICRLHSTKNEFNGREPWRFRADVRAMAGAFLRLRHRLIPYLYTMNHRAWAEGVPLCLPMYYLDPDVRAAYSVPNEYYFGTELICAPITTPAALHAPASVQVYLPAGTWYDFFTGMKYEGGRTLRMYRGIERFPVLAKAGAIVPLTTDELGDQPASNPAALTLRIFPGADGGFTLYEDDGATTAYLQGAGATTAMAFRLMDGAARLTIAAPTGDTAALPAKRRWRLELPGVCAASAALLADGKQHPLPTTYDADTATWTVEVGEHPTDTALEIVFPDGLTEDAALRTHLVHAFLDRAEMPYDLKASVYQVFCDAQDGAFAISQLQCLVKDEALLGALTELAAAQKW